MELLALTQSYLESRGYSVSRRQDLLSGTKPSLAGRADEVRVWVPTMRRGERFETRQSFFLSRFGEASRRDPNAGKFLLVDTRGGISPDFIKEAKDYYQVSTLVPVEFFDTPFKWEVGRVAATAASELATAGKRQESFRVPQPYQVIRGAGKAGGQDLVQLFTARLFDKISPGVAVVTGPAGIGKTIFFRSLFTRLLDRFIEMKAAAQQVPRPLPLIPEYIQGAPGITLAGLTDAFIRSEFASKIERETLEWMLVNGFGLWMLDGLDEVIDRDQGFFLNLTQLMTEPHVPGTHILICVRDSLLNTNESLNDFIDACDASVYKLDKWKEGTKKKFAERRGASPADADRFVRTVRRRALRELSATPFYCNLIFDLWRGDNLMESYSETELLQDALEWILEREYEEKGLLDRQLLPIETLTELLEVIAWDDLRGDFRGLERGAVETVARLCLPAELDLPTTQRIVTHVVQLAVFARGEVTGRVQFDQEIIEHYLIARLLFREFTTNRELFFRDLAARFLGADSVTARVLSALLESQNAVSDLIGGLKSAPLLTDAFRNGVQIAALAHRPGLREVRFVDNSLAGVRLSGLDFNGVSFDRCDLSDTQFEACILKGASFEGSILNNTSFDLAESEDLAGANFGKLERFYSIRLPSGRVEADYGRIKRWIVERTGSPPEVFQPCPPAKQLRILFTKFVYPGGQPKRAVMPKDSALRGKREHDPAETLRITIKSGYIKDEPERYRDRITRVTDDRYREMIQYVTDWELSPGIRHLLDDLCPTQGCIHVPA